MSRACVVSDSAGVIGQLERGEVSVGLVAASPTTALEPATWPTTG